MPWGTILLGVFFTSGLILATPYFITGTSQADILLRQYMPYGAVFVFGIMLIFGWIGKH